MITRPQLIMPIRDAEDLLAQADLTLVVEEGLSEIEAMRNLSPTSIWRRVYERLEFLKFHDGYSGFLQFNTRWSVFTYYWAHVANDQTTNPLKIGSTIANLQNQCHRNIYNIRNMKCINEPPLEVSFAAVMY